MDLGLTNRTYIVSGGTTGLGFAVASTLVGEGANVVVGSRKLENVERAVSDLGGNAHGVTVDIREPQTPERMLDAAVDRFGDVHGLFVSHGGPPPGPATELDDEMLAEALQLATVGPIRLARDVAERLPADGSIVVLTSTSSVQPYAGLATSNVARPAVWGYVKTLADEVGPRGIRVNALLPGRFATTRIVEFERDLADRSGSTQEEIREDSEKTIPLRRLGDPRELGRVAAFLLSPAASYVTGSAWAVDGGVTRGL